MYKKRKGFRKLSMAEFFAYNLELEMKTSFYDVVNEKPVELIVETSKGNFSISLRSTEDNYKIEYDIKIVSASSSFKENGEVIRRGFYYGKLFDEIAYHLGKHVDVADIKKVRTSSTTSFSLANSIHKY